MPTVVRSALRYEIEKTSIKLLQNNNKIKLEKEGVSERESERESSKSGNSKKTESNLLRNSSPGGK